MQRKALVFVGMPGSGKSTCVNLVENEYGWPRVYFGGIVLDEVRARGLEINEHNERMVRESLRHEYGPDVLARKVGDKVLKIYSQDQNEVVVDGLYSWSEYKTLRRSLGRALITAALVAPRMVRYQRLGSRPERPLTEEEAEARDISEIENLEKGGPIAFADHYILNDAETSLAGLRLQIAGIVESRSDS